MENCLPGHPVVTTVVSVRICTGRHKACLSFYTRTLYLREQLTYHSHLVFLHGYQPEEKPEKKMADRVSQSTGVMVFTHWMHWSTSEDPWFVDEVIAKVTKQGIESLASHEFRWS